nr:PREDICTED: adenylate cyclase type 9 [Bemisia tabaci]XP_018900175.1 PREDICTED: adenylate cyclase type 9 [Bemisia tabaci]
MSSRNPTRKTRERLKSLHETWVSFSPKNQNVEIWTDEQADLSEGEVPVSMAPYIQAYLAYNTRIHCCGLFLFPAPFERASSSSWLNPKFDSEVLEEQYRRSALPQIKLRFRYALMYIIAVLLSWSLYLFLIVEHRSSTVLFISAFIGFAIATCFTLVLTRAKYYHRFKSQLYHATSILMFLLVCLSLLMVSQSVASPIGQLCLCLEILMIIYTVIPFPLYLCFGFGAMYSAAFEYLLQNDLSGLPVRILSHICIHLIGIHILIMTNVRMRGTFMKVGQSLLVRKQLEMEKQLKEKMIHSVMPPKVAEWLMSNEACGGGTLSTEDARGSLSQTNDIRSIFRPFIMNRMENVSILFADIVGFTQMSSTKTAEQLVSILNNLFERFDEICEISGCEKISTLGDCYYCVSGCPEPRPDHASCCIEMGLGMIVSINEFVEKSGEKVNMRVGVHTGSVLCGIVGTKRFKFDVWSNDVSFANKMETTGEPGRVHLSQQTRDFLEDQYTFQLGSIIDGIQTYFILEKKGVVTQELPRSEVESPEASSSQKCISFSPTDHHSFETPLLSVSCDSLPVPKTIVPASTYILSKHLSFKNIGTAETCSELKNIHAHTNTRPSFKQEESTIQQSQHPVLFSSQNNLSVCNTHIPSKKVQVSTLQWIKATSVPNNLHKRTNLNSCMCGSSDHFADKPKQLPVLFGGSSNRWQYCKLKLGAPGDKVEGGLQLSLTDSNDEKNENISELVTRKDLSGDNSRVETSPRMDDQLSMCQSSNSRKDSGIRSNSRRSSILQHIFATPSSECQRVSGYYTSSQSSLNLGYERSGKLPPPEAVSEHFGVCFQHIRKQSDLQLIRCVQANSASRGSYFVKPPLSPFSLFFTERSMELEYRKKSHREPVESHQPFGAEPVAEPPTLATPRFNTYLDIIISLLVFMAVSCSLFLLWDISAVWLAVFIFASISQIITVIVCLRSIILASTDWFLDWYSWHFCGAILVSLPVISVLVNFPSNFPGDFTLYSIQHYCYIFFISLIHFCNFTQLNCWMKSTIATVAAVWFLILIETKSPAALSLSAVNQSIFLDKSNFFVVLDKPEVRGVANISTLTQSHIFADSGIPVVVRKDSKSFGSIKKSKTSSSSDLKQGLEARFKRAKDPESNEGPRIFNFNLVYSRVRPNSSAESLSKEFKVVLSNRTKPSGTQEAASMRFKRMNAVKQNGIKEFTKSEEILELSQFYCHEIYLDIALLLLLIWFLNREFEISYRLSFYGNIVAAKDKAHVQSMRDQADWLLHNIIPRHVADHLKHTARYSENVQNAGVVFASLVNFSEMYDEAYLGGRECLRVLNELISDFDELLNGDKYPTVEKIKTIGSTFMAASGLNSQVRKSDTNDHLFELMDFAIALQQVVESFNRDLLSFNLILRIGYNYGDVTAGVIGTTKLHYDIWGDPVNIASRMDSTGVPGRIQVPSTCLHVLLSPRYQFEPRGQVFVKGKNNMYVYLLAKPE